MRTMALPMRRALTPAIVLFWLVMVGLLVHEQAPPPSAPQAPLAAGTTPGRAAWCGVERDGKRVGPAPRARAPTATGLRFTEDLLVSLIMLGVPQTVRTSLDAETDDRFALRRVRFTLASPATAFSATGTSDGRRLTVTYGAAGRSSEATILLTEPVYLPVTLRARVLAGDTTPGTTYTVPVFNPLALRNEPLTVKVDGRAALDGVDAIVLTEEQHDLRASACTVTCSASSASRCPSTHRSARRTPRWRSTWRRPPSSSRTTPRSWRQPARSSAPGAMRRRPRARWSRG